LELEKRKKRGTPPVKGHKKDPSEGKEARSPVVQVNHRKIGSGIQVQLVAATAGRCEFRGCNEFLFVHPLTKTGGNFSEMAHIVAFKEAGPRGHAPRPEEINGIDNLMLLCPPCHKLVDDQPSEFPVKLLLDYKNDHERRIHDVGEAGPELRTEIIQLKGLIGGQSVDIPAPHVREAVRPRYVADKHNGHIIDVAACLTKENEHAFEAARRKIRHDLKLCFDGGIDGRDVRHFSVFALAPIPVLIVFGRALGDKVATDIYQRHRGNQSWAWKESGTPVTYKFEKIRSGSQQHSVALLLSLSGRIVLDTLPAEIDARFSVYELTLAGEEPNREFLQLREDLIRFRQSYQQALSQVTRDHGGIREIHLFPAVPAPVAVACGQELLPKAHPDLIIYDNVKSVFQKTITVNTSEEL